MSNTNAQDRRKNVDDRLEIAEPRQIDEIANLLKDLSVNISKEDRDAYEIEGHIDRSTISRYLNGHARNLDIAIKMLDFFRLRIQARDVKILSAKKILA